MRRWTREEDAVIRMFGNQGAAQVSKLLYLNLGARRTQKAVECRASRIGASLVEFDTCISCGRRVRRLWPDGYCDVCHERRLLEATKARMSALKERDGDAEYRETAKAVHKERAVWRAAISKQRKGV